MIFLHGTATMHSTGLGKSPEERIKQSENNDPSILRYSEYIPVGNANEKIRKWREQGAEIVYLSSNRERKEVDNDLIALKKNNFPDGEVYYRQESESYADVAERVMPDVLIEDDCESIGGKSEMTYPYISEDKKKVIKSIVVKEFSGIDNLPDDINELCS